MISRCGHVEQHFTKMGAPVHTANVCVDGFAPTRSQGAAHQFVHVQRGTVTFWVRDVGHVGDHIENLEVVVHCQSNVQTMNGLTCF